jgi:hypothetical protein
MMNFRYGADTREKLLKRSMKSFAQACVSEKCVTTIKSFRFRSSAKGMPVRPRFFPVSNPVYFPIQALAADICVAAFSA